MKRAILFLSIVLVALSMSSCSLKGSGYEAVNATAAAQAQNLINANVSIPVPALTYFQERRTVDKWAKFWDKANLPCYVYVFMFDRCIGYYVSDGKPASTRSYLQPEYRPTRVKIMGDTEPVSSIVEMMQTPDLDGTYGDNNAGIRFFTADGIPVEVGGAGASYMYSAYPLNLDVPKLVPRK